MKPVTRRPERSQRNPPPPMKTGGGGGGGGGGTYDLGGEVKLGDVKRFGDAKEGMHPRLGSLLPLVEKELDGKDRPASPVVSLEGKFDVPEPLDACGA